MSTSPLMSLPRKALVILAGCPDGATEATLRCLGFSNATLRLIRGARFATASAESILCNSLVVRYRITAAGREALR